MANEELNIVLKLIDDASAQLKGAMEGTKKEAEGFKKTSEQASKSIKDNFKEASKQVRDFRRSMFVVTATIGTIIVTTKEWSRHNQETKKAYDTLGLTIKEITALIGSLFAPTIIALADLMKSSLNEIKGVFKVIQDLWTNLFKTISYGVQFVISFFAALKSGVGVTEAYKIATQQAKYHSEEMAKSFKKTFEENIPQTDEAKIKLEEYSNRMKDLELLFKAGQISVEEYFKGLLDLQDQTLRQNEVIIEQTQAYVSLLLEVSNTDLMNFQANLQGKMDFFNTYKELYIQGHAEMFAFANMLANEFHTNMSEALSSIILGEKNAEDAFKDFGKAMVKAIVDYMVQQAVAFVVSQIMQKVIQSTTSLTATGLARAWAPAAAMASLATLGQNAGPAMAGMAVTTATAYALAAPKPMARGGEGIITSPTLFLAGERGAERFSFKPLRKGGDAVTTLQKGGIKSFGDTYINIEMNYPMITSDKVADEIINKIIEEVSYALSRETERYG